MKKVLVDSDAYTSLIKGSTDVRSELETAHKIYMSVIVLGELLAAFKKGRREKENLKILKKFLLKATVEIIEVGKETAEVYANIKSFLEKEGKPIPINDLWIASQTLETGSALITYDKHFLNIPGLRFWSSFNHL
ncbi:twitching motility protein PilT [Candidatus Gottesmanbacteria bacterium RIFCSPHIGHO2_02_FULL_39_14]|uniref:Twitching motility protein PilT n=1 Tax=Candidatus Gottesmanbacteria bacterium RIFCSPHIGHO2_02_FULL_39_14 TaxID=1798383 RepID=A0A1F5ZZ88_9BACT|nr:MAG: twitching motility protein PilT [Candidatus Gottesmanbacteria bacterium RIFCSPHIGHO2_02_FULL_39_14]